MSRPIKFRAWDKKQNQMFPVFFMDWQTRKKKNGLAPSTVKTVTYGSSWPGDTHWTRGADQFDIMQFTGLTDKNGKEIYEGDIVRLDKDHQPVIVKYGEFPVNTGSETSHRVAGFYGDMQTLPGKYHWFLDEDCEVIGNIHENPELVK